MSHRTLVIHDVELPGASCGHADFFFAKSKAARCKGCFGCWLKTPGECVMHDGSEHIGALMAQSDEVYIVSAMLYGGFSLEIKRVLDRCIPGVLPFFTRRNGRMHHAPRYRSAPRFHVVFYGSECASERERALAPRIAQAMAVNMNAADCDVTLIEGMPRGEEVASR